MKIKYYSFWLAVICIIVYLLQVLISGLTERFLLNQLSFVQPWRFITAIFLHASLSHLILNMFALLLFGFILEKTIGSRLFLLTFFSSGIIANLISVNFYNSSLGASGAIYGIIGVLAVLKPLMTVWAFSLPMPMFIAAILWAIGDILQTIFPSAIGTIAHLSGLFIGIIAGIALRLRRKQPKNSEINLNYTLSESAIHDWEDKYMKSEDF
ncbi:rhomboid family intramembrane serine protease [Candidatus Pacearchaeota archaeon]|nr:rhomboid family intramembrane serine protease [Candidatus Pacearchaeota archaeon]